MNGLDIICGLLLLWGVWRGWREGIIMQLCGIVALVIAVYFAYRYGNYVGSWFSLEGVAAEAVGFLLILLLVVVGMAFLGRALRSLFRFAGLGMFDVFGGAVLGGIKVALLLSVVLQAFGALHVVRGLDNPERTSRSWLCEPIMETGEAIFPYLKFVTDQIK